MLAAGLLTAILAGLAAFAVARVIYRHAGRLGLVADPNERSSHTRPTPSGGGVGIVAGGTIGSTLAVWAAPWPGLAVVALSLLIALIGFVDDRRPIPAVLRLAAQLILVALLVATLPLPTLATAIGVPLPELVLGAFLVAAIVYWINIFNFMDGIDGIAASQAAFMLIAAAVLAIVGAAPNDAPLLWWLMAIAAASLGFLTLNWPPARIFMGDAGSTYLGFMLAYAALATIAAGSLNLWQWLILGALFITDATLTLVRRLLRREPIFRAHRLHAYQHLSRQWKKHGPVTLLAIAVNVVWLLPLAWMAGLLPAFGPVAAAIAYPPLVVGLALAGAGRPESSPAPAAKS